MSKVIKVENLSKAYQLGDFGTGTISRDLERFWARMRGKEDPFLKIGEVNDRTIKGESDVIWSLKDINFEIEQGDTVGIIGRNGAGKSTLLKILSRVTSPTTGSVKVKGRIVSLLEVGTGFHPELTGRENIYLNGAILGMRKAEIKRKFDEIVDFSGVDRYIDTPVKRYSSGMYVRLAFAVAAHLDSEILIVDEVLAVGDAEFQKKCLGKMGDVSKGEGRTILFVSHNMRAIQTLCKTSFVIENGLLKFVGSIEQGIAKYLTEQTVDGLINYNNIKYYNKVVQITNIQFNNSDVSEVNINNDSPFLNIKIKGHTSIPNPIALECLFYDTTGTIMGMYSHGHYDGDIPQLNGEFLIDKTIEFPERLNKADLVMDLLLTYPGVETYVECKSILNVSIGGFAMKNGHVFSQSAGAGFLYL